VSSSQTHSYGQILKSSALIGASSAIDILFRIVRVKAIALWLGPSGVGLFGLFTSIADLSFSLAGLGFESSGVRQIALAVGTGDGDRIARTVRILRWSCALLGLVGAALLVVFAAPVSRLTFGTDAHAGLVALLALAVSFRLVTAGQAAVLRGMRRIADLARMDIWGALLGTALTLPLIYFLRDEGIVPSIVAAAAVTIATSWWYSRKIRVGDPRTTASETGLEVRALLRLGFAFALSGLMTMGVAYAVRVLVLRELGVEAAGHYQAAWTIGSLYVGFILQAMGTDFYPRLTAAADAHDECNRLVNEQAQVSLLLAGPGLLATLSFAPLVIALFYSREFQEAEGALRWICLGMSLRVVTWPLGFIVVAKGMQRAFIAIDVACSLAQLGLAWLLVPLLGVDGAGMAFFGLYVFHAMLVYPIARSVTGFRWSAANKRIGLVFLPVVALVLASFRVLPWAWATAVGALAVAATGIHSLRTLALLLAPEVLPGPLRRLIAWVGLAPKAEA
jgi:PST family polysaccharide transporter